MARGFFITGTDTGVGKTVVTAALIKAIRLLGLKVCGMKPIETGCLKSKLKVKSSKLKVKEEVLIPSDGMFLREMAGMNDSIDLVTPIRFKNPLAPLPASEIEGVPVDLKVIQKAYRELSKNYDVVIVEGIGGLLVPITKGRSPFETPYFVLDLAKDFGLPIVVVSRPGLGTINHTMLTVNYATKEGLNVAGIIINYSLPPEGTLAEDTNPEVIKQFSPVPIIGIFPYLEDLKSGTIEKAAVKNLDIKTIKKYL
ncbi:MAG: dethiobiotin synthase [Thermodesulfovibrionales bacterium]|nr:dethiobiotin synthase [Thermodesulfovibrionales bacterium]